MLSRMVPSSPPAMRTFHLLKTPDILCATDIRQAFSYSSLNNLEAADPSVPCGRLAVYRNGRGIRWSRSPESLSEFSVPLPPKYPILWEALIGRILAAPVAQKPFASRVTHKRSGRPSATGVQSRILRGGRLSERKRLVGASFGLGCIPGP
jgi:hypothetical protein